MALSTPKVIPYTACLDHFVFTYHFRGIQRLSLHDQLAFSISYNDLNIMEQAPMAQLPIHSPLTWQVQSVVLKA